MDGGEQEESSAKRRERLLALRSAAAASPSPHAAPPPLPAATALDLPGPDMMDPDAPSQPQRFGFYTNPGAAFSSTTAPHKRKSAYSSTPPPAQVPPPPYGNCGGNYPPPHQQSILPSPIHPPSPMPPGAAGNRPWRSPMQFQTPMSGYRGAPPGAPPPWNPHSFPAQGSYPPSPSTGFRNSDVGRGGRPMYHGPGGSSYPSSGQARGENYYNSPGSRGRGGRGRSGFQNRSGWEDRRNYYSKSMVIDPWQGLQPIVGNILIPCRNWLPESPRAKRDTSDRGQIKTPSSLSLSEYLDSCVNQTSNET